MIHPLEGRDRISEQEATQRAYIFRQMAGERGRLYQAVQGVSAREWKIVAYARHDVDCATYFITQLVHGG